MMNHIIYYLAINYSGWPQHFLTSDPCPLSPANRGGVHLAAVLGASPVGGPGAQRLPPLPLTERVAAQGEPQPQDPTLFQQGEGKSLNGHHVFLLLLL